MLEKRLRQLGSGGKGEAMGIFASIENTSHGKFATVTRRCLRKRQ
jgi:hypothetical protein